MPDLNLPTITVIIPVKPGGYVKSLEALKTVDYPRELIEVIVAEGRQPSVQRNHASREATGDILYFLDDDSVVPPDTFNIIASRYNDPKVSAVGGPIITPDTDRFLQKGYGLALSSMFGGSSIRARYKKLGPERQATENDLILANLSFRREVFVGAGGFNENLYPNEENELMNKLQEQGHVFLYVPDAFIYRSQRETYRAYLKQVFTYGRGRMDQNFAHPEGFRPLHLAPALFLLYCISLLFFNNFIYFLPALLYLSLCIIFSAASAVEGRNPLYFFIMPVLFLSLHLGYGAGFIRGIIKGFYGKKKAPYPAKDVLIRRVQV
jgi:cellulose synthase/poly-beta-1,6-N-acetylglucosamine synthase-like glycosyltransferase